MAKWQLKKIIKKRKRVAERSLNKLPRYELAQLNKVSALPSESLLAADQHASTSDLVHKVCDVVDHVEEDLIHGSKQVAKQIAQWVDTPANCDNQAHGAEGACNSCAAARCGAAGFTIEDFEENEEPAQHATGESRPCQESADLTH